jgi:hypothetical protein
LKNLFYCFNLLTIKSSAEESEGEEENEDKEQRKARLHQIRVEAGKKAAATRKAHAQGQVSHNL